MNYYTDMRNIRIMFAVVIGIEYDQKSKELLTRY
jgi:hypothetical protein